MATGTDNSGGLVTFQYIPPSGSTFNVATTPVLVIGRDPTGNQITCQFNVVVQPGIYQ